MHGEDVGSLLIPVLPEISTLDTVLVLGAREKQEHNQKLPQMAAMLWEAWGERWEKRQRSLTKGKAQGVNPKIQGNAVSVLWPRLVTVCMLPRRANELISIKNKLMNNPKETLAPSSQSRLQRSTCRTKPKVISRQAKSCPGSQHPAGISVSSSFLQSSAGFVHFANIIF